MMDLEKERQERHLSKAQMIVFYMNNIRKIDPSFHRELKFIRDEVTESWNHTDYLKVSQVIKHILKGS